MPDQLLQQLADGVLIGLVYSLVAIGLTLIWGVMNIVNFAHGDFLMLGHVHARSGSSPCSASIPSFRFPYVFLACSCSAC